MSRARKPSEVSERERVGAVSRGYGRPLVVRLGPPASSVSRTRVARSQQRSSPPWAPRLVVLSNLALESNGKMHEKQSIFVKFSTTREIYTRGGAVVSGTEVSGISGFAQRLRVETATYLFPILRLRTSVLGGKRAGRISLEKLTTTFLVVNAKDTLAPRRPLSRRGTLPR